MQKHMYTHFISDHTIHSMHTAESRLWWKKVPEFATECLPPNMHIFVYLVPQNMVCVILVAYKV